MTERVQARGEGLPVLSVQVLPLAELVGDVGDVEGVADLVLARPPAVVRHPYDLRDLLEVRAERHRDVPEGRRVRYRPEDARHQIEVRLEHLEPPKLPQLRETLGIHRVERDIDMM